MRANEGQRRPTKGKTQVNEGPQRPTTANDSQRRPTQAHTFRPYVCFFFVFCSKLTILYKFYLAGRRPTQADEGPQQLMTANAGPQRQQGAQTTRLASFGPLYVFFSNVPSICHFFITSPSTCSCFFSNKPRSEPEPGLGPLLGPGSLLFEARAVSSRA